MAHKLTGTFDAPLDRLHPLGPAGEALEFRILGPVEARRGGECLRLGGHRQLAVLVQLILEVGRVVSTDRLTDGLWADEPPAAARSTLQGYVCRLRRVLDAGRVGGAGASALVWRNGGYLLAVDPDAVDARRFEVLTARGRAALGAGQAEVAAGLFEEALNLWRGPALADFADEPFAAPEAGRLEELRLSAIEDHVDAALALGRHRTMVAELEPLVAAHPFRERLRGQLMVALHRSGRQPEALRLFQAGRRLLAEELGIEPGAALKTMEAAILRQDPALDWTPPMATTPPAPDGPALEGHFPTSPVAPSAWAVNPVACLNAGVPLSVAVFSATDPVTTVLIDRGILSASALPDWVLVVVPAPQQAGAGRGRGAA